MRRGSVTDEGNWNPYCHQYSWHITQTFDSLNRPMWGPAERVHQYGDRAVCFYCLVHMNYICMRIFLLFVYCVRINFILRSTDIETGRQTYRQITRQRDKKKTKSYIVVFSAAKWWWIIFRSGIRVFTLGKFHAVNSELRVRCGSSVNRLCK